MEMFRKFSVQFAVFFLSLEIFLRLSGALFFMIQKYSATPIRLDDSHFRILCVGDSIATGPYVNQLREILNKKNFPFYVNVFDRTFPGATSETTFHLLEKIISEYKPHMVIALAGLNDESMVIEPFVLPHEPPATNILFKISLKERILQETKNISSTINQKRKLFSSWAKENIRVVEMAHGFIHQLSKMDRSSFVLNAVTGYRALKVRLNPEDPTALLFLGLNLAKREEDEKALQVLKEMSRFPGVLRERGDLIAETFMEKGQLDIAEEWLVFVLSHQEKASFYLKLAECYKKQGKFYQISPLYEKAIAASKSDEVLPALLWADSLLAQQRYNEAEKILLALLRKGQIAGKLKVGVYENLKKCYMAQGKIAKTKAVTKELIKMNTTGKKYKKKLYELTREYGSFLVAVQYPMMELEQLEREFDFAREQIVYIDNRKIFEDAINEEGYYKIFYDMSGPNFGHFTDKGAGILASNVAQGIEFYLNDYVTNFK